MIACGTDRCDPINLLAATPCVVALMLYRIPPRKAATASGIFHQNLPDQDAAFRLVFLLSQL
jgi:hypothetical protein